MSPTAPVQITFALLTYNQERFVKEALRSALAQTYGPLEILICDDRSSDATVAVIEREIAEYTGPHPVRLHRNPRNLGCTGNTLSALALARTDLVVFGAGDDISEPERVAEIATVANAYPQAHSFWSWARLIDENGHDLHEIARFETADATPVGMARSGWAASGSTLACRKSVGSAFGDVDRRANSEDIVLHFRASLLGGVVGIEKALVRWRRHGGSMESMAAVYQAKDGRALAAVSGRVVEQRKYCFRQRTIDAQHALAAGIGAAVDIQAAMAANARWIADLETLEMIMRPGLLSPVRGALRSLAAGISPRETAKRLIMLRWPGLWLSMTARSRRKSTPQSHSD